MSYYLAIYAPDRSLISEIAFETLDEALAFVDDKILSPKTPYAGVPFNAEMRNGKIYQMTRDVLGPKEAHIQEWEHLYLLYKTPISSIIIECEEAHADYLADRAAETGALFGG